MIETIEHFAQTQPNISCLQCFGAREHTYGDLKADSDSLAAAIDQLGLWEISSRRFWWSGIWDVGYLCSAN